MTDSGEAPAAAAQESQAQPTLDAAEPLIDASVLASLEAMSGRGVVREWVQAGLSAYERSLQAMEQEGVTPSTLAAEAHKLRGSASTLGLARIGTLGMRIEEAARAGSVPSELVMEMRESMKATRSELARRRLI